MSGLKCEVKLKETKKRDGKMAAVAEQRIEGKFGL